MRTPCGPGEHQRPDKRRRAKRAWKRVGKRSRACKPVGVHRAPLAVRLCDDPAQRSVVELISLALSDPSKLCIVPVVRAHRRRAPCTLRVVLGGALCTDIEAWRAPPAWRADLPCVRRGARARLVHARGTVLEARGVRKAPPVQPSRALLDLDLSARAPGAARRARCVGERREIAREVVPSWSRRRVGARNAPQSVGCGCPRARVIGCKQT